MKKNISLIVLFILVLCVIIYCVTDNYIKKNELDSLKKDIVELQYNIHDINKVIPQTKPSITMNQLKIVLENQFPEEKVELLDDHIRWRFFSFWFTDGKIRKITYGS